jgi:pimeloyl-ACP methyl ester carboxylesterase
MGVGGGAVAGVPPADNGNPGLTTLVTAGRQVLAELHPDSAGRVELFTNLAGQAEQQRKSGKTPTNTPEQLLALAITGWLKGKNGADPSPDAAVRLWQTRQMLIDYQNEGSLNNRRAIANKFVREATNRKVPFDEIAQLISLLPPPQPENLLLPNGVPIAPGPTVLPGLRMNSTGPLTELAAGMNYVLRLPPEYHHGRPYPVMIALSHPGTPPEQLVSLLAAEADRNGYIIAAPVWFGANPKQYDYSGNEHFMVTAVLRDLLRHYRVDNDRVFLFGLGAGGTFAMDVGASHPDLFAGVVTMAPMPQYFGMFSYYWRNAQKLPFYTVTGNINGTAYDNLRKLYEQWMPKGFPALMTVYRGRGLEWYTTEVPTIFKWMCPNPEQPRKRVTGNAALKLGQAGVEPWYSMRAGDNRFYWVGLDDIVPKALLENNRAPGAHFEPAHVLADIQQGNRIVLNTLGVKHIVIWLDRDMIDWDKKVSIVHNNSVPKGYKPAKISPDLDVMLEALYHNGDRSLLYLNKIELDVPP